MSWWLYQWVRGAALGFLTGLFPGLHPILFRGSVLSLGVMYGLYVPLSYVIFVSLGVATPENFAVSRGTRTFLAGALLGALLTLLFLPLSALFTLRPPALLISALLVLLLVILLRRDFFTTMLACFLGFVALRLPLDVSEPIIPLVSGLFGLFGLQGIVREDRLLFYPTLMGVLAGLLVSYFPALSSALAFLLLTPLFGRLREGRAEGFGAAATSSLFFSTLARKEGLVRTALAAALPSTFSVPLLFASLLSGLSLGVLIAWYVVPRIPRRMRALRLLLPLYILFAFGVYALLLFLAAAALGYVASRRGSTLTLTAALLYPTLLYYA